MRMRLSLLLLIGLFVLAACAEDADEAQAPEDGAPEEPTEPTDEVEGEIGPPEKTDVVFGARLPNAGSQAILYVGMDQGFFEDEGLELEIITTESVREGLVGGSLDFGMAESTDVVEAAAEGLDMRIVSAYRNRQPFWIVGQPGLSGPEELAGANVYLGGTPGTLDWDIRSDFMAANGWDISDIDADAVNVAGGSNAALELFLEGEIAVTYVFARHRPIVNDFGAVWLVDEFAEWPNDSVAAMQSFVDEHPNTTARFIRALIRSAEVWLDPDNQEYVQDLMEANEFNIAETERDPDVYAGDLGMWDEDMGLDPQAFEDLLAVVGLDAVPFEDYTILDHLHRAQESLGFEPRP